MMYLLMSIPPCKIIISSLTPFKNTVNFQFTYFSSHTHILTHQGKITRVSYVIPPPAQM